MDELERLFKHVVDILTEQGGDRLRMPLQVSELYQSIIPYRRYRSVLRFDTNQDYEMAVLRLLSGERGFVSLEPPEAQEALRRETMEINPNPSAFREFAAATVRFDQAAVGRALDRRDAYAPPDAQPGREAPAESAVDATPEHADAEDEVAPDPRAQQPAQALVFEPVTHSQACRACRKTLPTGRSVIFCPFCGADQRVATCRRCGTELELEWEFCITCGETSEGD